uniref:Retrovirus-related Pol polyprotein from transposon TNT 1-94 n=1 Tax=Strongyloides venezuelensis TaxID=75913 RepID=A0A0K0F314_STRVS
MITAFKCVKLWPIEDSDDDATEKVSVMIRTFLSESLQVLKTTFGKSRLLAIIEVKRKLFRDLKNKLATFGRMMAVEEAVILILQSLPNKYDNIKARLSQDSKLNFELCCKNFDHIAEKCPEAKVRVK